MKETITKTKKIPFVKLLRTPLGYYAYDVNKNSVVKLSEDTFKYIKCLQKNNFKIQPSDEIVEEMDKLSEQGYLSDNKVKVIKHPDSQYLDEYLDNRVSKITLQVTQSCNLKCKYCPYAYPDKDTQRSHSIKRMTYETAKKAIDYYFDHSNENQEMNIGFYGGEPLLEVDLIKKCIEYVKSRCEGRIVTYSMTSI